MRLQNSQVRGGLVLALGLFAFGTTFSSGASAQATEKERLKQCEVDLCKMVVDKKADGPNLGCDLSKTWAKEDISKEANEKKLPWELGDAKCSVKLNVERAGVVDAMSKPDSTLKIAQQTVNCEVEQGGTKHPISLSLAPQITFKDGQATTALLNVSNIEAPAVVKGVIWSAAKLEENFGIFHGDIIREINKFVSTKCPKTVADAK